MRHGIQYIYPPLENYSLADKAVLQRAASAIGHIRTLLAPSNGGVVTSTAQPTQERTRKTLQATNCAPPQGTFVEFQRAKTVGERLTLGGIETQLECSTFLIDAEGVFRKVWKMVG
jgi:hypothetical protein